MANMFIPLVTRTRAQMAAFDNEVNSYGETDSVRLHYLDPLVVRMTNSDYDTGVVATAFNNVGPNGTFTTNTVGWTVQPSATLATVAQRMQLTNSGAAEGFVRATAGTVTVAGAQYAVQFDAPLGTSSHVRVTVGTAIGGSELANERLERRGQRLQVKFTADDTSSFLAFGTGSTVTGQTVHFDNVTVQRIPTEAELGNMALFKSAGWGQPWKLQGGGREVVQYTNNANNNTTNAVTTLYPNYVYVDGVMTQRPA